MGQGDRHAIDMLKHRSAPAHWGSKMTWVNATGFGGGPRWFGSHACRLAGFGDIVAEVGRVVEGLVHRPRSSSMVMMSSRPG